MPDIAIIGGGVAGLTAGLYAARGGVDAVVYEEMFAGGQAAKTSRIENYPGFPGGLDGFEIGARIEEQAKKYGLTLVNDSVTALDLANRSLTVNEQTISAGAIILCMGATPRKLDLAREEELTGRGVSYCATCDGAFFRGRDTAVIGGGDTALSDALYLARLCKSVTVIHRRDTFRASATLVTAARALGNIHFAFDTVVTALQGESTLSALTLRNVKTGGTSELPVSGAFVAVGVEPQTALIGGQLKLSRDGSVPVNERMETGIAGVYAAGDIRSTPLRQIVTACADGAIAATEAVAFLSTIAG